MDNEEHCSQLTSLKCTELQISVIGLTLKCEKSQITKYLKCKNVKEKYKDLEKTVSIPTRRALQKYRVITEDIASIKQNQGAI